MRNTARHTAALLVLLFASAACAEENFKREVTVRSLEGWFSTYSIPIVDTKWTIDVASLLKKQESGKIDFIHADKDKNWYFPYQGVWRLVTDKTTQATEHVSASRVIRLVNESTHTRTTVTVELFFNKTETACRGFFVFEEIEGPIRGVLTFH